MPRALKLIEVFLVASLLALTPPCQDAPEDSLAVCQGDHQPSDRR